MTLPIHEVHAEGHFRRRRYTLKMLLSGHLVGKEFILTDQKFISARFFLFGETANFVEKAEDFARNTVFQNIALTMLQIGIATPAIEPSEVRWRPQHRDRDEKRATS